MKIAHIIADFSYGGAEKFCMHLCNYQVQFHEVYLISLCDYTNAMYSSKRLDSRIKLITLGKRHGFDRRLFIRLYRVLRSINPSIIHTNSTTLFYAAFYILLHHNPGVFHTVHTFAKKDAPGPYHLFYSVLLKLRSIQMVANSGAVLKSMKKLYGRSYGQYIHLGTNRLVISSDYFQIKREVEGFKHSEQGIVFIHIGRIAPEKNQLLLYKAFLRLIEDDYDVILLVLGEIQSQSIFDQLEKLSHPRIHFLGRKDNIADYLSVADAFCLTSDYEGLSLATIEAVSMKVIPICTPAGGVEEVVKDGYNGFLSDDHTVDGYVKAIRRYLSLDDQTKKRMRENAFLTYQEHFTIEQCGKAYLDLYEEIVYKKNMY